MNISEPTNTVNAQRGNTRELAGWKWGEQVGQRVTISSESRVFLSLQILKDGILQIPPWSGSI